MSALVSWAKNELDRLMVDGDEVGMQKVMNKDILKIVQVFADQDHTGFTAPYAINIIKRLLNWKPITPLTGDEDEWNDVGDNLEQNNRCSAVFRKNKDNTTAYYIDGKVFSDDGGQSWYTNRDSFIPITFPFVVPEKPEYIILENVEE